MAILMLRWAARGHGCAANVRWTASAQRTACPGVRKEASTLSPSRPDSTRNPSLRPISSARIRSCSSIAWRIASGLVSHLRVESSTSVSKNVTTPPGGSLIGERQPVEVRVTALEAEARIQAVGGFAKGCRLKLHHLGATPTRDIYTGSHQ